MIDQRVGHVSQIGGISDRSVPAGKMERVRAGAIVGHPQGFADHAGQRFKWLGFERNNQRPELFVV